jgi:hypothetical protein
VAAFVTSAALRGLLNATGRARTREVVRILEFIV